MEAIAFVNLQICDIFGYITMESLDKVGSHLIPSLVNHISHSSLIKASKLLKSYHKFCCKTKSIAMMARNIYPAVTGTKQFRISVFPFALHCENKHGSFCAGGLLHIN